MVVERTISMRLLLFMYTPNRPGGQAGDIYCYKRLFPNENCGNHRRLDVALLVDELR